MQELVDIAFFVKDSANGVYYTLIQFWPFTVLFGLFLIFICLDFFVSGISHLKIIPIKPIQPIILRAFNIVKFKSVNPVHLGQLKPIKMKPLKSPFLFRLFVKRKKENDDYIENSINDLNLYIQNLKNRRDRNSDKLKIENEKINNWQNDIKRLNKAISFLRKKGGTVNEYKAVGLENTVNHLKTNIHNFLVNIDSLKRENNLISSKLTNAFFKRFNLRKKSKKVRQSEETVSSDPEL